MKSISRPSRSSTEPPHCGVGFLSAVYPDLAPRELEVSLDYINSRLGLDLPAADICKLLCSMQLDVAPAATAAADGNTQLLVRVPPTRSDILHACDVMEDVAIAYGYNNLAKQVRGIGMRGWPL